MKRIFITSICLLIILTYKSQQNSMTSQYLFNDFAINPAVAGTKSYSPLSISFRRQWVGITWVKPLASGPGLLHQIHQCRKAWGGNWSTLLQMVARLRK